MGSSAATSIVWLRRDLRLDDHPALVAAAASARAAEGRAAALLPLYVVDPRLVRGRWASSNRTWFLLASLRALDEELHALGSRLVVRIGDPLDVVPQVARAIGAREVHVTGEVSPYGLARDRGVRAVLGAAGVRWHDHPGLLVHDPATLLTRDARPYTVFGPYRRAWEERPRRAVLPAPRDLSPLPAIEPGGIPTLDDLRLPPPTADPSAFPEAGPRPARARLRRWLADGLARYAQDRDRLDLDATSRLSQDLRFGLLSPLEVVEEAIASASGEQGTASASAEQQSPGRPSRGLDAPPRGAHERTRFGERREDSVWRWLSELCWRDFYLQLLFHHPDVLRRPFRRAFERFPWADDEAAFAAWRDGRTGYPVVDAAMRQLGATGFMPNRARMVVASFLAKDLRLDWRLGETHFMNHLVDGEPAANDGGWQWTASTGTDAQPWFRVFDPVTQGRRFDPAGQWVRRWVPELDAVPAAYVHEPWTMPADVQAAAGCSIGVDYPEPIVRHAEARARWLASIEAAGISPRSR